MATVTLVVTGLPRRRRDRTIAAGAGVAGPAAEPLHYITLHLLNQCCVAGPARRRPGVSLREGDARGARGGGGRPRGARRGGGRGRGGRAREARGRGEHAVGRKMASPVTRRSRDPNGGVEKFVCGRNDDGVKAAHHHEVRTLEREASVGRKRFGGGQRDSEPLPTHRATRLREKSRGRARSPASAARSARNAARGSVPRPHSLR